MDKQNSRQREWPVGLGHLDRQHDDKRHRNLSHLLQFSEILIRCYRHSCGFVLHLVQLNPQLSSGFGTEHGDVDCIYSKVWSNSGRSQRHYRLSHESRLLGLTCISSPSNSPECGGSQFAHRRGNGTLVEQCHHGRLPPYSRHLP